MPGSPSPADLLAPEQTPLSAPPIAPATFALVVRGAAANPQALAWCFVFGGETFRPLRPRRAPGQRL